MLYFVMHLLLAGIPSLGALYLLRLREAREGRGWPGLVLPAFVLGFLAVLPAFLVELSCRSGKSPVGTIPGDLFRAFLLVALTEEGMKFLAVRVFLYRHREFRRISHGMRISMAAGFGFAFFENIFYIFGSPAALFLRGLSSVPLHGVASGILGYYLGLSRFTYRPSFAKGVLAAVIFHGFYNFFLFRGSAAAFLALPTLAVGAFYLKVLYNRALIQDEEAGRRRFPLRET